MPSIRLLVTPNPVALSPSAEYFNSLLSGRPFEKNMPLVPTILAISGADSSTRPLRLVVRSTLALAGVIAVWHIMRLSRRARAQR